MDAKMNKLNYLCEIKNQIAEVNTVRRKIRDEIELINLEERCMQEFRREMESLNQEKMTHVEELRQIHSDINMLDNVQKQSEEDRNRRVDAVRDAYQQLQAMKSKIDKMCGEIDMPRMYAENNDDEDAVAAADLHQFGIGPADKQRFGGGGKSGGGGDNTSSIDGNTRLSSTSRPLNDNTNTIIGSGGSAGSSSSGPGAGSFSSSLASLMSGFQEQHQHQQPHQRHHPPSASPYSRLMAFHGHPPHPNPHHHPNPHQHPNPNLSHQHLGSNSAAAANSAIHQSDQQQQSSGVSSSAAAAAAAFRQQPPPMKSCGSCHQQIHRNAPICPLCKAKSRSRHPKRRNTQRNN